MNNAVSGSTSGNLALSQYSIAGNPDFGQTTAGYSEGLAGNPESILTPQTSISQSITTLSSATGGNAQSLTKNAGQIGTNGGSAKTTNLTQSSGDSHSINATGIALGGASGGYSTGGSATSNTSGIATGNSEVKVNNIATEGGNAGSSLFDYGNNFLNTPGNGGNAKSTAIGSNIGSQKV
jgi:hypothetical protein